jgi:hypothetical protein
MSNNSNYPRGAIKSLAEIYQLAERAKGGETVVVYSCIKNGVPPLAKFELNGMCMDRYVGTKESEVVWGLPSFLQQGSSAGLRLGWRNIPENSEPSGGFLFTNYFFAVAYAMREGFYGN